MITFNSIVNENIFVSEYASFSRNNTITFPAKGKIAVLYGPNGTGKTSLVRVLQGMEHTSVSLVYGENTYSDPKSIFHVINDQNSRNVIAGSPEEFFLGDNIRNEYRLKEYIDTTYDSLAKEIIDTLKESFGISTKTNPLLTLIQDSRIAELLKSFANNKSKGNDIRSHENLEKLSVFSCEAIELTDLQQRQLEFFQQDYSQKDSIIKSIERSAFETIVANTHVYQIEENTEAIKILERFHKNQCVVCDTDIDWKALLTAKTSNRELVLAKLDDVQRKLLEQVIQKSASDDPFSIKEILLEVLSSGNATALILLKNAFAETKLLFEKLLLQKVSKIINSSDFLEKLKEYEDLLQKKVEIEEEDLLYIKLIINNCMDKQVELVRNEDKNIVVALEQIALLGKEREDLPLSAGEQNFISLTFEFLKAKNAAAPIIVIDDPVSSFDSIYKNKVVYAMVKMLENKKRLILTHNTDLLRLFDAQYKDCYNLYLLSNIAGGENGFIPVNKEERKLLTDLSELVHVFRTVIFPYIVDEKRYLLSMVPFIRGYASITQKKKWFGKLTCLMHGSMTETVDIVLAYRRVFNISKSLPFASMAISVPEILSSPLVDDQPILDCAQYPLLDKTLRHSLTYLYLRLLVEKKLIEIAPNSSIFDQLGTLIDKAFPRSNSQFTNQRVFLTSKKTLINEFNHFEGNLSIFQPAIDISDQALKKEKQDILGFVDGL
jgi:ABC-type lipoprotein export system ATPase subunit